MSKRNQEMLDDSERYYPQWIDILRQADSEISAIFPDYVISDIKDKFGGLRFYISLPESYYDYLAEDHTDEEIEVMNDKVRQAFDISHRAEDEAVNLNALS